MVKALGDFSGDESSDESKICKQVFVSVVVVVIAEAYSLRAFLGGDFSGLVMVVVAVGCAALVAEIGGGFLF